MKKCVVFLAAALLLTGCAAEPVYETIPDVCANSEPAASAGVMEFQVPEEAEFQTSAEESGIQSYTIGQWEVWTQVFPGGDIRATLAQVTGLSTDALTVMQRQMDQMQCHETTWTTTDENGVRVGRAAVLDDGNYHYCFAMTAPEEEAERIADTFAGLLATVTITDTGS